MRTKNVFKNTLIGFARLLLIELLRFGVRTVFIYTLSKAYLGINGLFSNILSVLSIAELGFGSAIVFAMYKPLADGDTQQIKALVALYKKAYRIIGISILAIGLALTPFLPYILKGMTELVNLYFVFLLHLLNTVSSYFFFAYKASLLAADQKQYIVTVYNMAAQVAVAIINVVTLLVFRRTPALSFYIYTLTQILSNIVSNIVVARKVDKLYPYICERDIVPLEPEKKRGIMKNVAALSISKVSSAALTAVDSLVISMTLLNGVSVVGVYSNYLIIVSSVTAMFVTLSTALTSSLGNFYVTETVERNRQMFDGLHLFYVWSYGFCGICLWTLLNPFIGGIWINPDWLLSDTAVFLITVNFLLNGLMAAPIKYIQAAGLYWQAKLRYVISAVLNIGLSVLFVVKLHWGIEGVLLATTICMIGMVSRDPYIVFKNVFKESSLGFYVKYAASLALVLATGFLVKWICSFLPAYTVAAFVLRLLACLVIPNGLWLLLFRKTKGFQFLKSMAFATLRQYGWRSKQEKKSGAN